MKHLIYFIFFTFSWFSLANSDPYQIQLISPYAQAEKNQSTQLGLWIQLEPDWYTYWSYAGDFGKHLDVKWKLPEGVSAFSQPFPYPERYKYTINNKNYFSFIYKKEVLIPFEIFIEKNYAKPTVPIQLELEFSFCKDICISQSKILNFELPISASPVIHPSHHKIFKKWQKYQPQKLDIKSYFEKKDSSLFIHLNFKDNIKCLDIFPKSSGDFSSYQPRLINQTQNSCFFKTRSINSSLPVKSGLLTYKYQGKTSSSFFNSYERKPFGIIWFILMAFLGGLLLNIMPCVLPIIFLKFYHTLESSGQPKKSFIKLNLSYAAGVILSFLALALFIFISKRTGESIGWGFHLQSPLFVTILSIVFSFMAFYLLGLFSMPMPKVALNFKDNKMFSHFLTGVLSTTAASPCTVPFMAPAVGFAFSRNLLEIFVIFFFLGLGLSFPYLFLSIFPGLFKYIPKPRKWINRLKSFLSIPLFLTTIWLIYLIYNQLDFQAFLITLFAFPLIIFIITCQNLIKKPKIKSSATALFFLLILLILYFQQDLNNSFDQNQRRATSDSIHSKFFIKKLNGHVFSKEKINRDKGNEEKILVIIGAEWCLTCKMNERIFHDDKVISFLKTNRIKIYYGDWTNRNPEITEFLNSYGQNGVPFYILYKGHHKTKILPNFLFKKKTLKDLIEFFLKE